MRIRTIKPAFFSHEALYDAEAESGLPLRVAFAGLWCAADREGRFRWRPRYLQTVILPYDKIEMARVLDALMTRGFIRAYSVDGEQFGVIPSFLKHQVINNRETASELPSPLENQYIDACPTRGDACPSPLDPALVEGKGREGNRKGKGVGSKKRSLSSPDFVRFWTAYPRKDAKQNAQRAFERLRPDSALLGVMLAAVDRASRSEQWLRPGPDGKPGAFIPMAATWLNGRRWEDGGVVITQQARQTEAEWYAELTRREKGEAANA